MKKSIQVFAALSLAAFTLISCASIESPEVIPETEIKAPEEEVLENVNIENTLSLEDEPETSEDESSTEEESSTESEYESEANKEDEVQDVSETITIYEDFLEEIIEPEVFEEELPPEPEEPEVPEITDLPEPVEAEPLTLEETSDIQNLEMIPELTTESSDENESPEENSTQKEETTNNADTNNINIDEIIDFADTSADEVENLDSETTNEEEKVQEEEPVIIPSRSVSLKSGQSLDIEYPGKGWIFLGATDGSKNLTSTGRKTNPKSTNFTLIARVPGTVILHFYKEDILEGKYIDDYLEVTVQDIKSKSSIHVKAPSYAEVVPKKNVPEKTETVIETEESTEPVKMEKPIVPEEPVKKVLEFEEPKTKTQEPVKQETKKQIEKTVEKTSETPVSKAPVEEPKPEMLSSEEYLSRAKKAQGEKNYTEMYNNLQNFLFVTDTNKDEGLYLLATLYEGNSQYRNIKKSVELYEEITTSYPLSPFYDEAEKRAIYLKKFYY